MKEEIQLKKVIDMVMHNMAKDSFRVYDSDILTVLRKTTVIMSDGKMEISIDTSSAIKH